MRIRNGFFDRREFLRNSGMFAAALAAGQTKSRQIKSPTRPLLDLSKLERFVDPLPIPGVLRPKGMRPNPDNPSAVVPYYRISMKAAAAKIHRDLRPTEFWGFGQSFPGPTIETRSGEGLLVEWVNDLPKEHFLPIDHGVHGAEAEKPPVRVVTHLHGGKVPPKSDGYPEDWYVPGKSVTYFYPNQQEAATLWYHDHTLGITRLNVYAGLAGFYLLRDEREMAQIESGGLPAAPHEVELVIQDRMFYPDGRLAYPDAPGLSPAWPGGPSQVMDFYGEVIVVN